MTDTAEGADGAAADTADGAQAPGPLDVWPEAPRRAALVLDFDGTLAPIIDDPSRSRVPSTTARALNGIAGNIGRLAIISGRPAHYLQRWVPVPRARLIGLYGLEEVRDTEVVPDHRVAAFHTNLVRARVELADIVEDFPGAHLEDKGNIAAIHWRTAEGGESVAGPITERVRAIAEREGLWTEDGKMVIEVRPPVDADKGTALREATEGFSDVVFAGDDVGDLPAFAAIRTMGGHGIAVDHGPETDPRVKEAAHLVVDGVEGMASWLTALAMRLNADRPSSA